MNTFHVYPIGSIYSRPEEDVVGYVGIIGNLPQKVKDTISSVNTVSYITGIAKTYDIPEEKYPAIAFAILETAIGKKKITQLSSVLSTELQLPSDRAQNMASEIEQDILGPIKGELDALGSNKTISQPRNGLQTSGVPMQNVLNLKELNAPPKDGQLPSKPKQSSLSSKNATMPVPRFPLPPRSATPPKPPVSPIKPLHFT